MNIYVHTYVYSYTVIECRTTAARDNAQKFLQDSKNLHYIKNTIYEHILVLAFFRYSRSLSFCCQINNCEKFLFKKFGRFNSFNCIIYIKQY